MRAMDLVQWQSTFRYMEDQGFNIQHHRRKGKEGGRARERLGMNPELRKVNLLLQNKTNLEKL